METPPPDATDARWTEAGPEAFRKPPKCRSAPAPLDQARRNLAERYLPLARAVAAPFRKTEPRLADEYDSAALLALVESAGSFAEGRGIPFPAWARARIRRAVLAVAAGESPRPPARPPPRPRSVGAEVDDRDDVARRLAGLPDRLARAVERRYLLGQTQPEMARALGVAQGVVSRRIARALALLARPGPS